MIAPPRANPMVTAATVALATIVLAITASCTSAPEPTAPEPATPQASAPAPAPSQRPTERTSDSAPPRPTAPSPAADDSEVPVRPVDVVDGDTVYVGRREVRVIGVDTPERGDCGFDRASGFTSRFLADGGALRHRSGVDAYDRTLAYVVDATGHDLGTALIAAGLANARYDGTDGYDWHPHQRRYLRLDRQTHHICGAAVDQLGGPEPYTYRGGPFPSCDAAEQVGATPLVRGRDGYNADLDGDGDGVACE